MLQLQPGPPHANADADRHLKHGRIVWQHTSKLLEVQFRIYLYKLGLVRLKSGSERYPSMLGL